MLLVIMLIFMLLLGFVFIRISLSSDKFENLDFIGGGLTGFCSVFLMVAIVVIIASHLLADNVIQKNKIQYEGLCKRYEIIKSEYEDVSKSDVINDITEWNTKVYNTKYWSENPWTNWFNPKKIADNMEYISLEEEGDE